MVIFKYAYILPILVTVWFPVTFIITYILAVHNDDVRPVFPYISDTGNWSPESCFFGLMLNIGAILFGLIDYIRYRQIDEILKLDNFDSSLKKLNFRALIMGEIAAFGIILVGNFQETNLFSVHVIGAGAAFAVGTAYQCIQTYISWKIYPQFGDKRVNIIRIVCNVICCLTYTITTITGLIAMLQYKGEFENVTKWKKEDGGYVPHLISAINEWILSFTTGFYILLYSSEFRVISISEPSIILNI